MDVSIIFCTCRRRETLGPTLEAMADLDLAGLSCEVVVVDNADDPATQRLIRSFETRLPLRWLVEPRAGHNIARNTGLKGLRGRLIIATDDDVMPRRDWVRQMVNGCERWPDVSIFTGRILPSMPIPYDLGNDMIRSAFMVADWPQPEGPIRPDCVWGPNMAFRRSIFEAGHRFDETIGPVGSNYAMGSEVEFVTRLSRTGYRAVYLPDATVVHQIRPEQFGQRWLCGRAFRSGRGVAAMYGMRGAASWFGVPRYLFREVPETALRYALARLVGDPRTALAFRLAHWHARGKAYQFRLTRQ